MSVRTKYPLDSQEESTLIVNLALTQLLLLLGGIIGAMIICGMLTGDWQDAVLGFGWADMIAASVTALPWDQTIAAGLALAAVFYFVDWLVENQAMKSDDGRQAIIDARQGVNGELARLSCPMIVLLLCMAGIAEELLFRFALLGGLQILCDFFMPTWMASLTALIVASFFFWLSHVRYRDFWSSLVVLILAFALGIAFLASGSVLVTALAHAVYDLADVFAERWKMSSDPDYFCGTVPSRVILDAAEAPLEEQEHLKREEKSRKQLDAKMRKAKRDSKKIAKKNRKEEKARAKSERNSQKDDEDRRDKRS